jgi:hypothetical protein
MVKSVKPITDENLIILNMMAARFRAIDFKSMRQMVTFKRQLVTELERTITKKNEAVNATKAKAAKLREDRLRTQGYICASWGQSHLKEDDVVKLRGHKGQYRFKQVIDVDHAEFKSVKLVDGMWTLTADTDFLISLEALDKIYHEGKWLEVYKLASGM